MRPVRVGDRFTIGPSATVNWTKLPRTITMVSTYSIYYTIDNGDMHTTTHARLNSLIQDGSWLPWIPEHLHLPVGA